MDNRTVLFSKEALKKVERNGWDLIFCNTENCYYLYDSEGNELSIGALV